MNVRITLWATICPLFLLLALQPLASGLGYWGLNISGAAILAYQLYVPIWVLDRKKLQFDNIFLLHTPLKSRAFWLDIGRAVGLMAISFPIFAFGYWAIFTHYWGIPTQFHLALPRPMEFVVTQIFLVALPEEFFYRGFIQGLLRKKFTIWVSILLASGIFALAHLITSHNLMDLLTFFPSMLFGWLVYRSGSLVGAIVFHAACNILGAILYWGISF